MVKLNILKMVFDEFTDESIVYTSGTGAIFKSGIPIGKVKILEMINQKNLMLNFIVIFLNLKYVFAEVITKTEIKKIKIQKKIE